VPVKHFAIATLRGTTKLERDAAAVARSRPPLESLRSYPCLLSADCGRFDRALATLAHASSP